MLGRSEFATVTDNVVVIADREAVGAIMVSTSTPMGICLSRGAAVAFRSLFFGDRLEGRNSAGAAETVFSAAEEAFNALYGATDAGSPVGATEEGDDGQVAAATRLVTFAQQLVEFVETAGPLEMTRIRPRKGDLTEQVLTSPTDISLGTRTVPLDPGRLQLRTVGEHTVGYHESTFEFPVGALTPDNDIIFTGGRSQHSAFARAESLAGCTTCGVCGSCAACTLCAEVNFAVAAGFLVAVDFAIHLLSFE